MIRLITGVPGAGKTLLLISTLAEEHTRPIYYHGINDLHPSLKWQHITAEQIQNWGDHVPDGAIVIIDEVQQHFGTRPPKAPIPPAISAFETHRHRGLDFYLLTQHPTMLDHHARRLVGKHTHLVRPIGTPRYSINYTSNEAFDPSDARTLTQVDKTRFYFPKKYYGYYKSTEIDTHRWKMPKKILLLPALVAVLGILIYMFVNVLYRAGTRGQDTSLTSTTNATSTTVYSAIPQQFHHNTQTYYEMPSPLPHDIPRTAGCIVSTDGTRCACYTQQAILQPDIPHHECIKYALFGEHDVFRSFRNPSQNSDFEFRSNSSI